MQISLKRGRFFTLADNERTTRVAVIDEALAEKYFPGQTRLASISTSTVMLPILAKRRTCRSSASSVT